MSSILKYSEGIQELVRCISPSLPKHPGHQRFSWPFSLDRIAGVEHARLALWRATFIGFAKLHSYRRHHHQSASLPPPSGAGQRAGDPR